MILEPSGSRSIQQTLLWAADRLTGAAGGSSLPPADVADLAGLTTTTFARLDDLRAAYRALEELPRRGEAAPVDRSPDQIRSWAEELRAFGADWPLPEWFPAATRSIAFDGIAVSEHSLLASEALLALEFGAVLGPCARRPRRDVVAAIGPGWGTFVRALKTMRPSATCVVIDRPRRLLFAATHLLTAFPEARAAICSDTDETISSEGLNTLDFLFVAGSRATLPEHVRPLLAMHLAAGRGATVADLAGYGRQLFDRGCRYLYVLSDPTLLPDERWSAQATEIGRYFWPHVIPFAGGPHRRLAQVLQGRWEPVTWKNQARQSDVSLRHVIWWRRVVAR